MDNLTSKVDLSQWSIEERKQLLSDILTSTKNISKKSYKAVESSFKWEDIKIDGKKVEECKAVYQMLIHKVRKYRTMSEIITDALAVVGTDVSADEYPDIPKKPPTAFSLFVRKKSKKFPDLKGANRMQFFANTWNELSQERKESYKNKYKKLKLKYETEMDTFRQNHPEYPISGAAPPHPPMPSKLFVEARLEKMKQEQPDINQSETSKILLNEYKQLSDKKKLKWIKRARKNLETYQGQLRAFLTHNPQSTVKSPSLHLSKEEQRIWCSSLGKPASELPKSLFKYFCNLNRENYLQLKISEQSKQLSASFRLLTAEELKVLKDKYTQEVEEYVLAYTQYYQSLSEEEKSQEKSPEVALTAYYKILKEEPKKIKKIAKKVINGSPKKSKKEKVFKARLSDVLPLPPADEDQEEGSVSSADESSALKRKGQQQDFNSPVKKKIKSNETTNESIISPKSNMATHESEEDLLSMWSPLRPQMSLPQDGNSVQPGESVTKSKKHKKHKKSKL